jgi:hypothetical protein
MNERTRRRLYAQAASWAYLQWLSGEDAQAIALDIQGARAAIARAR